MRHIGLLAAKVLEHLAPQLWIPAARGIPQAHARLNQALVIPCSHVHLQGQSSQLNATAKSSARLNQAIVIPHSHVHLQGQSDPLLPQQQAAQAQVGLIP